MLTPQRSVPLPFYLFSLLQSFAAGADIEDLGLHSPLANGGTDPAGCPALLQPGALPNGDGKQVRLARESRSLIQQWQARCRGLCQGV